MEYEGDADTTCNLCAQYNYKMIGKGIISLGNEGTSGDHPIYSLIKISHNIKKNLSDLRRLAVTQTPVEIISLSGY